MHNERTPTMRALRTFVQLLVGQLLMVVPDWLAGIDMDPGLRTLLGGVIAGMLAWVQNEVDDRRTRKANVQIKAPLTTGWEQTPD